VFWAHVKGASGRFKKRSAPSQALARKEDERGNAAIVTCKKREEKPTPERPKGKTDDKGTGSKVWQS
jgi:hypothetical protein